MPLAILLPAALFASLMVGLSFAGYRRHLRSARILRRLEEPLVVEVEMEGGEALPAKPGVLVQLLERLGGYLPVSPAETGGLRRELGRAGYRAEAAPAVFYGVKVVTAAALPLLIFLLRDNLPPHPPLRLVLLGFAAVAGFTLPNIVLERLVRRRQERLRLSLPDALDLMVVSVEAGLGLDQAMLYVTRELRSTHPEICDELGHVTLEMRAGKRRADALRNLAERTGEAEIRKLVAILVQNDRFGTSMAESLRTHSDFMRTRRRQEAEERAAKVGVKLVFPIFFFILPSMMLVTAGPGLLQIFKQLFPMMKQIR
ncbi:MAG TPA: type II secretion system F family protein [Bryobacteraceae bacterium]|nr:type II secretion system F family protein [Bryobacteraceae bacterium]